MRDPLDKIKTELQEGQIEVREAITPEDRIGRLEVVTERYASEGYLDDVQRADIPLEVRDVVMSNGFNALMNSLSQEDGESFMKDGLLIRFKGGEVIYLDKYHWQSVQFVARTKDGYVGSVRLVINTGNAEPPVFELPTLNDERIHIFEPYQDAVSEITSELSQYAIRKGNTSAAIGLLRAVAQYSMANGIDAWVATTDDRVRRVLNSMYYNFGLPQIGESVVYLGSKSTPILIIIEQALENAEQHDSSAPNAAFIRGSIPEGFEWYIGE